MDMQNKELMKSPFDAKTLQHFKELLIEKRRHAEEEVEILENRLNNLNEADDADHSSIAHHMGDMGSDVEEKQMNYQLLERTRKYIGQIDDALGRIENGSYGVCLATNRPISKERLEVVPHTRYSIEAKKQGLVEDL